MSRAECLATIAEIKSAIAFVLDECRVFNSGTPHLTAAQRDRVRENLDGQLAELHRKLREEHRKLREERARLSKLD